MTATLQDLYDDIKELIHQKFETKTEEDTTLPEIVESYFNYNQGELDIDMPHMKLKVTGSSFATYSSTPFTYNGTVTVDWGDGSDLVRYTNGKLSHSFIDEVSSHTVRVYGDITSLKGNCFLDCTNLSSIKIPDSVSSLGSYCFYGCTGLTSIKMPDDIPSLGFACFYNCTGLTSITLPNNVTSLDASCFSSCTNLTSINIPNSVSSLEIHCFHNCPGLISIQLNWTGNNILTYQSNWITNANSNLKFYIPTGTTEDYVQAGYPSNKLVESD